MSGHKAISNQNHIGDLIQAIERNTATIKNAWLRQLRAHWGDAADRKIKLLEAEEGNQLLSLMLREFADETTERETGIELILHRVRNPSYSISDMFVEFTCLQSAIEEVLSDSSELDRKKFLESLSPLRNSLCRVFGQILRETSEFYEHVIERGNTGFCQTDTNGCIVYANEELKSMIGSKNLIGKPLDTFFEGHDRKSVQNVLSSPHSGSSVTRQMQLLSANNELIPAVVELSGVYIANEHVGGYARITDLTRQIELQNEIFDRFLLGIIKLDPEKRITYTNRSLRHMVGVDNDRWKGLHIDHFVPDDENRAILKKQLEKRFKGRSSEYSVRLLRQDDGRTVPVKITASPELDKDGNIVGTMGIIRNMVPDNMHELIGKKRTGKELLNAVAGELRSVVPFDQFYVTLFSRDMHHVRQFFSYFDDEQPYFKKRWWEMDAAMIEWSRKIQIEFVDDIKAFYDQPVFRKLKDDPAVKHIVETYRSFVYYPVFKEDSVIACITLYSKAEKPYSAATVNTLKNLPLDTAVLAALHFEEKENLEFLIHLLKSISKCGVDVRNIARVITLRIADHFDWENVSLFSVQKVQGRIRLLNQATGNVADSLPENYSQSIDEGVLGYVYRKKTAVNIADIRHPDWKDIYKATLKTTRSELCLPIVSGDLFWLLNIEDKKLNAFADEEREALKSVIGGISVFLERSWLRNFLDKSLLSTSDAVLATDNAGVLNFVNSAALNLLAYEKDSDLLGRSIQSLLVDSDMGDYIIHSKKVPNVRVKFRCRDGNVVPVLLSKFQIHEDFSTNVLIAKDLSLQQRLQELEYIGKIYYEIAIQTKTPMTLLFSWLKRMLKTSTEESVRDNIRKSLLQLRKLELTYNRLALFDTKKTSEPDFPYNEVLFSITEIWSLITERFPKSEIDRIAVEWDQPPGYLCGDIFQITFCFESIIAYLLRFLPEEEKIRLAFLFKDGYLTAKIEGYFPEPTQETRETGEIVEATQTLIDIALGENIIRSFINKNKGRYVSHRPGNKKIVFEFVLPLMEETANV